ncbi:MAG: hydroxymethylbilane synthase [Ignavibacteriaceae bacterium]|nr:MAG: hydroxymethylbilane synthase [Ignavibacteriaceae bacterium]MBV6446120.1 Porphobilinogen deaminase [Ignavibacteriaceae bacterium]MBW7871984.1 hydroxymethylbilane synthase [Ignavibacteria bacterium]MBZ0197402.1 hydroxymethylbilane synthase [Ignavibacteriaceae bacterium]WKZ72922.1 MAG: hydroxymethylbilane synthase [Ignavibacteriaceae bacterium]
MSKMKIRIGTRKSKLALWQTEYVKSELIKSHPDLVVEVVEISTKGDKILDVALSKIGDKGLFTKELESELLSRRVDLAVHSLKDLETTMPERLTLAAVTKRHAVNDVLIACEKGVTIDSIREGGTVATGSLRRQSQLLNLRPDLKVVDIRGNVPTRIQKFIESDWDAMILARAGVERLGLEANISSVIPIDLMLPAVGQGALGLQTRAEDSATIEIVKSLHDKLIFAAVSAERAFLRELEGGCQVPIAAHAVAKPNGLFLKAYIGTVDGTEAMRGYVRGSRYEPEILGVGLARDMYNDGGKEIIATIDRLG